MRASRPRHWSTRLLGLDAIVVIALLLSPLPGSPDTDGPPLAAPTHQLTGTWEPLPANPEATDHSSDAVLLADGRIAVLYSGEGDDRCVAAYAPASGSWETVEVQGPDDWEGPVCFGGTTQFSPAPDGRFYSPSLIVDPSSEPWQVEWAPWRDDVYDLDITSDGQMYTAQVHCGQECRVRLYEVDPGTGAITQVAEAPVTGGYGDVITGFPMSVLFLGDEDADVSSRESPLISYDPATDVWQLQPTAPFWAHWDRAKRTSDGWIWTMAFQTPGPELYARDPETGEWLSVQLPPDIRTPWRPVFVDDGQGRLYAMDAQQPYVFTPGAVTPIPTPEPGGGGRTHDEPTPTESPGLGGLVPDTATPDRTPGDTLAIVVVALAGSIAAALIGGRYRAARLKPPR